MNDRIEYVSEREVRIRRGLFQPLRCIAGDSRELQLWSGCTLIKLEPSERTVLQELDAAIDRDGDFRSFAPPPPAEKWRPFRTPEEACAVIGKLVSKRPPAMNYNLPVFGVTGSGLVVGNSLVDVLTFETAFENYTVDSHPVGIREDAR